MFNKTDEQNFLTNYFDFIDHGNNDGKYINKKIEKKNFLHYLFQLKQK
jgi:hypothetical protein